MGRLWSRSRGRRPPGIFREKDSLGFLRLVSFMLLFCLVLFPVSSASDLGAMGDNEPTSAVLEETPGAAVSPQGDAMPDGEPSSSAFLGYSPLRRFIPRGAASAAGKLLPKDSRARLSIMLFLCGALVMYGASRWVQADKVAAQARSAAAARREGLQELLDLYEKKVRESAELTRQLAEKKAAAAKQQAEVQATAKETEKLEREMLEQLAGQIQEEGGFGGLVRLLIQEAEGLEDEAMALNTKLESIAVFDEPAEGAAGAMPLVSKALTAQRQLLTQRQRVLEDVTKRALVESRWRADLEEAQGGELERQIEKAAAELRELKLRKAELKREIMESTRRQLSAAAKMEAKAKLEREVKQLKRKLEKRDAARQRRVGAIAQMQADLKKKQGVVEAMKAKIAEAKDKNAELSRVFDKKKEEFLTVLASLEATVAAKEKVPPSCLEGVCKKTEDKIAQKRRDLAWKALASEALEGHKDLSALERTIAQQVAAPIKQKMQMEIEQIEQRLSEIADGQADMEAIILQQRKGWLEKELERVEHAVLEEYRGATAEEYLSMEARCVVKHRASLGIFSYFDDRMDDTPEDADLEQQFLRAQIEYEGHREHMLQMMDLAHSEVEDGSYGKEIAGLYRKSQTVEQLYAAEEARLQQQILDTKGRLEVTGRRYKRARRGLLALAAMKAAGNDANTDPTGTTSPILKRRLLEERTLYGFYGKKLKRLQERLRNLPGVYRDKLREAQQMWKQVQEEYATATARLHAVGATDAAISSVGATEENMLELEDYDEEDDEDLANEQLLAEYPDDPNTTDDALLGLKPAQTFTLQDLIAEAVSAQQGPQPPPGGEGGGADAAGVESFPLSGSDSTFLGPETQIQPGDQDLSAPGVGGPAEDGIQGQSEASFQGPESSGGGGNSLEDSGSSGTEDSPYGEQEDSVGVVGSSGVEESSGAGDGEGDTAEEADE